MKMDGLTFFNKGEVWKLKCVNIEFKGDNRNITINNRSSILRLPSHYYDAVKFKDQK